MPDSPDNNISLWLAGAFFAAWNGIHTLILKHQFSQHEALQKEVKEVSSEREAHCIPRNECERTHKAVDTTMSELKKEIKDGFHAIHARLDKVIGGRCEERGED